MSTVAGYRLERWIESSDREGYSEYWDDPRQEAGKPFDISGGDFGRMERYLAEVGLLDDLRACAQSLGGLRGDIADLAAGVLWSTPHLLALGADHVWSVEYSTHRLTQLGPRLLSHYDVDPAQVTLAYGSFYELAIPPGTLDGVLLAQAFHHADDPARLLGEIRRVLKPEGVVFLIGEHRIRIRDYAKYPAKVAVAHLTRAGPSGLPTRLSLAPRGEDMFPRDPRLGDHTYTLAEYRKLAGEAGFQVRRVTRRGAHYEALILGRWDLQPRSASSKN